ncbi:MAG: quinolinate synthase NadA [Gemmatimonadota bacterium]
MAVSATSIDQLHARLSERLAGVMPEVEIAYKAQLAWEVNRLKQERGAVILGHNYMEPALYHSVCDFVGDSLELARKAAETESDPIVFCGVRFMAETAKILNPSRTVLLPTDRGGCSLASSITAEDVRRLKARYPGVPVVTYVNTYADVKAECDVCCTSSNAVRVVEALPGDDVILIPDEYLTRNVAREVSKRVILPTGEGIEDQIRERMRSAGAEAQAGIRRADSAIDATTPFGPEAGSPATNGGSRELRVIGWPGRCEVHEQFTVQDIEMVRRQFPDVFVLAHPECSPEVVDASDFSGSTSAMIRAVRDSEAPRYLLMTECSMADNIVAAAPEKEMVRLCSVRCPHMNEITLEQVLAALRENQYVIDVEPDVARRARGSIERMLEIG